MARPEVNNNKTDKNWVKQTMKRLLDTEYDMSKKIQTLTFPQQHTQAQTFATP